MVSPIDRFIQFERRVMDERFADFERGVLQDNIILCDSKSGILLAFAGAMVIFSIDAVSPYAGAWLSGVANGLFLVAAAAFLVSCHFALMTVLPRLHRAQSDHIFWEAEPYRLPVEHYVEHMLSIDVAHHEKLRHLHMLASICRNKFNHFQWSIRFAQAGFLILVAAKLIRMAA
jgi:hypothetical protein